MASRRLHWITSTSTLPPRSENLETKALSEARSLGVFRPIERTIKGDDFSPFRNFVCSTRHLEKALMCGPRLYIRYAAGISSGDVHERKPDLIDLPSCFASSWATCKPASKGQIVPLWRTLSSIICKDRTIHRCTVRLTHAFFCGLRRFRLVRYRLQSHPRAFISAYASRT